MHDIDQPHARLAALLLPFVKLEDAQDFRWSDRAFVEAVFKRYCDHEQQEEDRTQAHWQKRSEEIRRNRSLGQQRRWQR